MNKVKLFITTLILSTFFAAQSQNLHNAKVMGIIAIGQKDVAIINDLTTGEVFKTISYNQGLLITDEDIQLDFQNLGNENKAKVVKVNLTKIIFCFKENHFNDCSGFCIKHYGNKIVVIRYKENNFRIIYRAITHGSKTMSNVRVFKKTPNEVNRIASTSFVVDTNVTSYKLNLHKDVIAKANNLKNTLTVEKWNKIINVYTNFLLTFRSKDIALFQSDVGQSTAFHQSIYKTIARSLTNNTECDCLPLPYYFTSKTPFMCQRDFVFNVTKILQTLEENKDEIKTQYSDSTILTLTNYFKAQIEPKITFYEIYFSLFTTPIAFQDSLVGCYGGTDLGCCGSYSGCCWYAGWFCLAHDLSCWSCEGWWCGGDYCNPE